MGANAPLNSARPDPLGGRRSRRSGAHAHQIEPRLRGAVMDRRTFLISTAAAVHAAGLFARQAAAVELGSIDGSVSGNGFTPAQFLDYLSSIKLTWAMISLPPQVLDDEAAVRTLKSHADSLGIKLQLAHGSVCPSSRSFNAQQGTLEQQVARALRASQI